MTKSHAKKSNTAVPPPEETIRIAVAERLSGQLEAADRMLAACENLSAPQDAECIPAVLAASRLLRSNSQVALSIARMIQLESRHRSISEKVQPAELNSKKNQAPRDDDEEDARAFDLRMARLLKESGVTELPMEMVEDE